MSATEENTVEPTKRSDEGAEPRVSSAEPVLLPDDSPAFAAPARNPKYEGILFISFFTQNTPYEEEAKALVASMDHFGVSYFVAGLDGRGSWHRNCNLKSRFIRDALRRFADTETIVWLDSDSVLKREPELFTRLQGVDLAMRCRGEHRSLRAIWKRLRRRPSRRNLTRLVELLRNTAQFRSSHNCVIFLRNNERVRQLVEEWIGVIDEDRERWIDQKALDEALLRNRFFVDGRLRLYNLPPSYADKNFEAKGFIPSPDAVIQQNQVSNQLRQHPSVDW